MDNITAPAKGAVLATDEIDGVHWPLEKLAFGAEGEQTLVSAANPLPVGLAEMGAVLAALTGTLQVSANALPLPAGAATQVTAAAILAKLSSDPATQATLAAVLAALTGTLQVSASALPLPAGAATQTTAAAILAKLSADPATQTTLAAVLSALTGTLQISAASLPLPAGAATQSTAAAILAKLSADPATQTTLAAVLTALQAAMPAGENFIGFVGGPMAFPTGTFTTTALTTPWNANQLIANNAAGGSVTPMTFANAVRKAGGSGSVRKATVDVTNDTGFAGQSVILKLYRNVPTLATGDRTTWVTSKSGFIGQLSVTLDQHFSDVEWGVGSPSVGNEMNFDAAPGSRDIYGLLVSSGTITPQAGSRVVTALLEILSN